MFDRALNTPLLTFEYTGQKKTKIPVLFTQCCFCWKNVDIPVSVIILLLQCIKKILCEWDLDTYLIPGYFKLSEVIVIEKMEVYLWKIQFVLMSLEN